VIRLAIIVEVRLYREGLSQILGGCEDLEVVLTDTDWRGAMARLGDARPDVILLDVRAAEARLAVRELGAVTQESRLVALGVADADGEIVGWAELGVDGYVTSDNSLQELVDVIASVARDEMPCSPRVGGALIRHVALLAGDRPEPVHLTRRQLEIVRLIERGLSNKEIGRQLCIEVPTVKNHVHNILARLDVSTRQEAVAHARRWVRVA
jgi:DNA-binding NarL/FixJ family response regulator